ncbi:MAG: carboxypeptidase-like regulatory domain-containing protein [Opitutales bacterium]|nr:carboxypeptidase-like regulatory domain-containing protein [Opitutales bacterium]MDP4643816.1 carboxypeptidase-like regulatory domain-containing protein [Opitutales bacterium]MDP4884712.1 carboxypeptidase-like regulatory domain-containing protein [Opitutales bacterium]MDP5079179.1 carboxypeptidase-like regulatory domain-containing protein [Opitutales bacterium]
MQNRIYKLAVALIFCCNILCGISLPRHFKVKVVDVEENPIANAEVIVGWSWGGTWTEGPKGDSKKGVSNSKGEYTFLGLTKGTPSVSVMKDGYYRTWRGKVEADPIQVQLRKQENPAPMYAKRAKVDLPNGNGDFGYDLFIGDLVEPHGIGKNSDIIFRVTTTEKSGETAVRFTSFMGISFSNTKTMVSKRYLSL